MTLYLFDNDGVLVSGPGPYESSLGKAIRKTFGRDIKIDLTPFHGLTDRAILREVLRENQIEHNENSMDRCLACFGEHYIASKEKTIILPTVFETLKKLNGCGNPFGIVTGNVEAMARKKLDLYGLNPFLPFGAFGEQSYERSDLIGIALKEASNRGHRVDKREVYVIGDTPRDIEAAIKSEVVPIGITTGKATKQDLKRAGARKVLSRLIELVNL